AELLRHDRVRSERRGPRGEAHLHLRARGRHRMSMFHTRGARTRRLLENLAQRSRVAPARRRRFDEESHSRLFRPRAVVFTDTADFTTRTAKDGIVHFLMIFDRAVTVLRPVAARH